MDASEPLPQPVVGLTEALGLLVEGAAPGGEFGAIFVSDRDGRSLVLKAVTGAHRAARWERGVTIASRLRASGYPAPEYFGTGVSGELVWSLQERLPGAVPEPLQLAHTSKLLELAELHVDAATGLEPIGSEEPQLGLSLASAERLQQNERTAAVAREAERVLRRGTPQAVRFSDLCHGDFHHRNLLSAGDTVTGVFDWEGASCGDWRFDVATLAFWCTVAARQVQDDAAATARARAEEICEPPVLAYFTAALTTRLLSFYLHAHPDFIDSVVPAITQGIVPWWNSDTVH